MSSFNKLIAALCLAWLPAAALAALPIPGRIVQITGEESVSSPYRFEVDIDGKAIPGPLINLIDAKASFQLPGGRSIAGIVRAARAIGRSQSGVMYRIEITPQLSDAAQTLRYRTFQEMTTVEIVTAVLEELDQQLLIKLRDDQSTHALAIQYGESDLDFIDRLLAHDGIYYYFEHSGTTNTMVLMDRSTEAPVMKGVLSAAGPEPLLQRLEYGFAKHSGTVRLNSYDFAAPQTALAVQASSSRYQSLVREDQFEVYTTTAEGAAVANRRLQAQLAAALQMSGASTDANLASGSAVQVADHPQPEANQTYFVVSVRHTFDNAGYRNEFTVTPASIAYRPPALPDRPHASVARARVVGPAGAEIHVDEFGRVKIAFAWMADNDGAPWVRALQPNVHSLWLPRVGEEVLVGFVNGNPSEPVVLGSLFNGAQMPTYELPNGKTIRSLRSLSSPAGAGSNELLFGDSAGAELLRLNAAKNMDTRAANDRTVTVGNDHTTSVGRDHALTVGRNQAITITGDQQTTINGKSALHANSLLITGEQQIVFRVGAQMLVIDANGVKLPQPATPASPPPTKRISRPTLKQPTSQ